ncbi:MAG: ComEC/Rec2 family competence protein [Actinomycetota bacterium]
MPCAVAMWAGAHLGRWWDAGHSGLAAAALVGCVALARRSRTLLLAVVMASGAAWASLAWSVPAAGSGECGGTMRLVDDPRAAGRGTAVVVDTGEMRLRAVAHGPGAWRLSRLSAGDSAELHGECGPSARFADRDRVSHVLGTMRVSEVGAVAPSTSPAHRAANRMRRLVERGVRHMPDDDAALFMGLVIGDDRHQPRSMVEDFRASGLSHLCSVSGQNVAYVLALCGPLLRRLRPAARLLSTLAVIAWFVVLTRAEPSVLRASMMAAVVAVNFFRGSPRNARDVLAVSVTALLVVDPMLAHSVGFALSAGATAGLAWLSRPLGSRMGLPGVLAATVAAQAGTVPVALVVVGRVPLVSLLANPLAVPVAGAVMLVGIPAAVISALLPDAVAVPMAAVMVLPVRWVAGVASVSARIEPRGLASVAAWVLVAAAAVLWVRRHRAVAG